MTPVETLVLLALTAGSPAPTSAEDRVYATPLPDGTFDDGPAISYQRVSSLPTLSLAGDSFLDRVRIQIDCWASTYLGAKTLANEVRFAMANYSGLKSVPDTTLDDYEADTRLYRVSVDFFCWER